MELFYILFFAVFWPLMTIAAWSLGIFGVSATRTDRSRAAFEREKAAWPHITDSRNWNDSRSHYKANTFGLITLVMLAGPVWPLSVPLWLAWKKGDFIDKAVMIRELEKQ